jgi:hypothetical protein
VWLPIFSDFLSPVNWWVCVRELGRLSGVYSHMTTILTTTARLDHRRRNTAIDGPCHPFKVKLTMHTQVKHHKYGH